MNEVYAMWQIEMNEGYMVCTTCRGYIDASEKTPICDCLHEDLTDNT